MSDSSTGLLLLYVLLIVVAMGVLDRFEAWRLRVPHPRPAHVAKKRQLPLTPPLVCGSVATIAGKLSFRAGSPTGHCCRPRSLRDTLSRAPPVSTTSTRSRISLVNTEAGALPAPWTKD